MTIDQPLSPSSADRMRRPFGLKAIIVLQIVQAIASVAVIVFYWIVLPRVEHDPSIDVNFWQISNLSYILLAPLRFFAALGLGRLRRWAWVLTMTLIAYSMAMDAIAFFHDRPLYFSMVLNVILVFYLNQREVQELFAVPEPDAAP